jgi:hypothetical protein
MSAPQCSYMAIFPVNTAALTLVCPPRSSTSTRYSQSSLTLRRPIHSTRTYTHSSKRISHIVHSLEPHHY